MRLLPIIIFLLLAVPCGAGEPVLLVTNEYGPYVQSVEKRPGVLTEIMVAAFEAEGVETRIEFKPWRRCAMMVEHGEVLGAFPYGKTEKRSKYAWFSDPIWECRNVFFYMRGRLGEFDFTDHAALKRFMIAGTAGNYYEDIFKEKGLRVDYAPGEASGIRKVWEMRTELFAEDELVGWTLISRIFPAYKELFASTITPWNINPQHLMFSKRYPRSKKLMERFNLGLKKIQANGEYDRIVKRYIDE